MPRPNPLLMIPVVALVAPTTLLAQPQGEVGQYSDVTVTGAILPFAVVLGLLGVPAWILVRRLARRRTPAAVAAPAGPPVD